MQVEKICNKNQGIINKDTPWGKRSSSYVELNPVIPMISLDIGISVAPASVFH